MKKWMSLMIVAALLTGCSFTDRSIEKDRAKRYESLWNTILSQDKFETSSPHFTIATEVVKGDEGYSVDIAIDKPTVAMYNVEVFALLDNQEFDANNMMPSAGVLDGEFNMIPNQVRPEKGYIGGIRLNGLIANNEDNANVKIVVAWKDEKKQKANVEFFEFEVQFIDKEAEEAAAKEAERLEAEEAARIEAENAESAESEASEETEE